MNNIFRYFLLSKVEKKAFINIFLITLFAMSSLLLANILYADDLTRLVTGKIFWNDVARPLSSLVSVVLQLGKPLTNISPLPRVLAFAVYSLSAIYLGKLFKVHNLLFLTLSGIVFVLNPFNLENFAFMFDSFPMAVAVLTSTLAALAISLGVSKRFKRREKIISFSLSLILILCSLCLYQAGTSVYLVTCFFYALVELLNRHIKTSFHTLIASVTILVLSFAAYLPIKNFYIDNEYALHHSKIISFSEFPQEIVKNLKSSWNSIYELLGNGTLINLFYILFIITIFTIIVSAIIPAKKTIINSNSKSLVQNLLFFGSIVFYILLLITAPLGAMLILDNPSFEPRVMVGFSTLVAICCLFLSHEFSQKKYQHFFKYCLISFLCILSLAFSNVSLTFGNVLYSQNVQDKIVATLLVSDLGEIVPQLPISRKHPTVAIVNALDYTYGNALTYKKYPILDKITWYYLKGNVQFYSKLATLGFKFGAPHYGKHVFTGANNEFVPKTEAILTRALYKIYFEEDKELLVVVLQNPNDK